MLYDVTASTDASKVLLPDQVNWTIAECTERFSTSVTQLHAANISQTWDKDDAPSMDFVCAVSNLRSHIFNIPRKSRFDVKSTAGNIIPAIATTNAIIAGLIVMEAFKVFAGDLTRCRAVYLSRGPGARNRVLTPLSLQAPNPKCTVCSTNPEISVTLNLTTATVGLLAEEILKKGLGLIAPSVSYKELDPLLKFLLRLYLLPPYHRDSNPPS